MPKKMGVVKSLKTMAKHPRGREGYNEDAAMRSRQADALERKTGKTIPRVKGFGLHSAPDSTAFENAKAINVTPAPRKRRPRVSRGPKPE